MSNDGFTLIETTIYCCIISLLGVLVSQFFIRSYSNFQNAQHAQQQIMALYATHDVLIRDLEMASPSFNDWHEEKGVGIVCVCNNFSIGWECKKGKLYRIVGTYDFMHNEWNKRSAALIAQDVSVFDCEFKKNNQCIEEVSLILGIGKTEPLKTTVSPFNRIVV